MESLKEIHRRAAKNRGGAAALEAELPKPKSRSAIRRIPDHRILSEMSACVFRAGFVWRVIEHKWPGFEEAFERFDPATLAAYSEKDLKALAKDTRIVRNPQKIRAVRDNAKFLLDLAGEHQSAACFFANWPAADVVALWDVLKQRGSRLGGMTGQFFLRHLGVDTPILTGDVVRALREQGVIETSSATSKSALRATRDAFDAWRAESGRANSEISKILACSVGE